MNLCGDPPYPPYLLTSLPPYLLTHLTILTLLSSSPPSLPPYLITLLTLLSSLPPSLPPYLLTSSLSLPSFPHYLITSLNIQDTQSLVSLVRALVAVSRGASGDQDSGEAAGTVVEAMSPGKATRGQKAGGVAVSVGSVTFCLRLLTEIALRNRDRIESTLSIVPCIAPCIA